MGWAAGNRSAGGGKVINTAVKAVLSFLTIRPTGRVGVYRAFRSTSFAAAAPVIGIRIRQAHILKGVVAPPDQFQFVAHDPISLKRFRRARIKSISGFGVFMPWVNFFWKAWTTRTSSPICTAYTARYALPR